MATRAAATHIRCMRRALAFTVCLTLGSVGLHAQDVTLCTEAERFLAADLELAVKTDPDTIDDWRTGRRMAGCRITAAGLTRAGLAAEATRFYERVRQAGWSRTPDPRDAPAESSLRFRKGGADCLFNVYQGALLLTDAERQVSAARIPTAGESRYNVFVLCVPALPARPRNPPRPPDGAADAH